MKYKLQLDWIKVLTFIFVSGGLLFITKSVMMSAGLMILLLVIDQVIVNYQSRKAFKQQWQSFMDERKGEGREDKPIEQ